MTSRYSRLTEWVLEPVDEHGDILDPMHYPNEREARKSVNAAFSRFPEAVRVDLAKCIRIGNNDEGEVKRDYDYVAAFDRYVPDDVNLCSTPRCPREAVPPARLCDKCQALSR